MACRISKDFFTAREQWKDALAKQKVALEEHRQMLEVFKLAYASITEKTPDSVADSLQKAVQRETEKVKSIEVEIRGTERILATQYSLRPAS